MRATEKTGLMLDSMDDIMDAVEALQTRVKALEERPGGSVTDAERDALKQFVVTVAKAESGKAARYAGIWQRSATYERGAMVTDKGGLWYCAKDTAARPGESDSWQLMARTKG